MRIAGVNIPDDKKIKVSLTYIYGIGRSSAEEILRRVGIDKEKRAHELDSNEINKIQSEIEENYEIEGELREKEKRDIERLKEIGCYRGERHEKDLPVRGQTTQKNSRTVRGNVRNTLTSGSTSTELK
ncbi:MAG: 30S ribosomal protein S13 [Candidatus Magasanikbacteria bacterium]